VSGALFRLQELLARAEVLRQQMQLGRPCRERAPGAKEVRAKPEGSREEQAAPEAIP